MFCVSVVCWCHRSQSFPFQFRRARAHTHARTIYLLHVVNTFIINYFHLTSVGIQRICRCIQCAFSGAMCAWMGRSTEARETERRKKAERKISPASNGGRRKSNLYQRNAKFVHIPSPCTFTMVNKEWGKHVGSTHTHTGYKTALCILPASYRRYLNRLSTEYICCCWVCGRATQMITENYACVMCISNIENQFWEYRGISQERQQFDSSEQYVWMRRAFMFHGFLFIVHETHIMYVKLKLSLETRDIWRRTQTKRSSVCASECAVSCVKRYKWEWCRRLLLCSFERSLNCKSFKKYGIDAAHIVRKISSIAFFHQYIVRWVWVYLYALLMLKTNSSSCCPCTFNYIIHSIYDLDFINIAPAHGTSTSAIKY